MSSGIALFMGMVHRGEFEGLEQRGMRLGVLVDTNSRAKLGDVSRFSLVERFDFSGPISELIEVVQKVQHRSGVSCLLNVDELYVAQTSDVAAALDIPCISPASARLCLDKNLMRQRFRDRLGERVTAPFQDIGSERSLLVAAHRLQYPLFLQPANVSASLWATRNDDLETLLANYRTMQRDVPRYFEHLGQKSRTLTVSLAEYVEGRNVSIDCLIEGNGEIHTTPAVDVVTGRDLGIDDFHHFARVLPSRLSDAEQSDLEHLAIAGCRSLDMTTAAAHVGFIGRKLSKVAAHPGVNRPRLLDMAFGIDLLYGYYLTLRARRPELRKRKNLSAAVVTPFAPIEGMLQEIRNLDRIRKLPGYLYHEIRAEPGQAVGLAKNGYRAPLYIELLSEKESDVRRAVDEIASWSDLYVTG